MALSTLTLEQLYAAFRQGYQGVRQDVSLAAVKTAGIVGTMAGRMAFTAQQGAAHIHEQRFPATMGGARIAELAQTHGVTLPPARKARMAALVLGTSGVESVLDGEATISVGSSTFLRAEPVDRLLPRKFGNLASLNGDLFPGSGIADGQQSRHTTWALTSFVSGYDVVQDLQRWDVLEATATGEILVIRRSHWGTRGLFDVYPVFPRGYRPPDAAEAWRAGSNGAVFVFEADEAGFVDVQAGDSLALEAADETLQAWALEVDNGGDAMTENADLAALLEMQLQGQAAGHNAQWWRELVIQNPHVAVRDALVYPGARGPGTHDIVPIPQSGLEVPEVAAELLHAYVRAASPEDQDPRVVPALRSADPAAYWVIDVVPQAGFASDPVGTFAAASAYGLASVNDVQLLGSSPNNALLYASPTPNNDWYDIPPGARMLLLLCDPVGNTAAVCVVKYRHIWNGPTGRAIAVTSETDLTSVNGSSADRIGWLLPYGDLLPAIASVVAPGASWPATDTRGGSPGVSDIVSGTSQRLRKDMLLSATGLGLMPSRTLRHGQSYSSAVDAGADRPNPPGLAVSWPPYGDHAYRDAIEGMIVGVPGVESATVNVAKSDALAGRAQAYDVPALNLYETPDVRVIFDLQAPRT